MAWLNVSINVAQEGKTMWLDIKRRAILIVIILAMAAGVSSAQVTIELVPLGTPGPDDQVAIMPMPDATLTVGDTVFVEIWAQTTDANGLSQVTTDLDFDPSLLSGVQVTHTALFNIFPCGAIADSCGGIDNVSGVIDNISGSHLSAACVDQVGVAPNWARVAIIEMAATAAGSTLLQSGDAKDPAYVVSNCGSLDPPVLQFGSATVAIAETVPGAPVPVDNANGFGGPCTTVEDCPGYTSVPQGSPLQALMCLEGQCYVRLSRAVGVGPNAANAGVFTARRVSVMNQAPGTPTVLGWMAEPVDNGSPPPVTSNVGVTSDIVDMPVYRDWSLDGAVHIVGCAVQPLYVYLIQDIRQGDDIGNEARFSAPLAVPTATLFGDVAGDTIDDPVSGDSVTLPGDGAVNLADVLNIVKGFQANFASENIWLELAPMMPDATINFDDILAGVKSFQGNTYLETVFGATDPCTCAGQSPCPPQ